MRTRAPLRATVAAVVCAFLWTIPCAGCGGDDGEEGATRPFQSEGRAGIVLVEGTERYSRGEWRKHGEFVFRDDRGEVVSRGAYVDGLEDGPWEQVYEDGAVGRGAYVKGERTGPWTTHHRNGQPQDVGSYERGMRAGLWVSRRDDGTLLREAEYVDGELGGRVAWYGPDGTTIDYERSGRYRRGKRVGPLSTASR
ncbi:MAG: hypothetical protein AAGB93_03995 [Planctomycetota bacterium]